MTGDQQGVWTYKHPVWTFVPDGAAPQAVAGGLRTERLEDNLRALAAGLPRLVSAAEASADGFRLDQVTVAVGVEASGEVGILVAGATVGANASLTLTFTRQPA